MTEHRHTLSEDRQPEGKWCWCPYPPEDQEPHCCVESGRAKFPCAADGAHVHPVDGPWR